MSFVNAVDMTRDAYKNQYAIGAFNTNNLEWTQSILQAAQDTKTPVIIQVSMGAATYMGGYKLVMDLVADTMESLNITVPVVMHLDLETRMLHSQSRMTEQVMLRIVISVLQYISKLSEVKCLLSTALGLSDCFMGW